MSSHNYTKVVALDRLTSEIQASAITVALNGISSVGSALTITFKADLDQSEITVLDGLVSSHVATPLPENLVASVSVKETPPFSQPTHRTKMNASSGWSTCAASSSQSIDFQLLAERYATGGEILLKDIKEGDYYKAEIRDIDEVIPEAYRSATCENWPVAAEYVEKRFLLPCSGYSIIQLDTYPLNARITAGLYIRFTLHTTSEAGDRKFALNYNLTKKL